MNKQPFTKEQHIRLDEELKQVRAILLRNTNLLGRHYPPSIYVDMDNVRVELDRFIIKMKGVLKEEGHEDLIGDIYYA